MSFILIALWVIVVLLTLALVVLFDRYDDLKLRLREIDDQLVAMSNRLSRRG
jgi:hypothetical protein